MVDPLRACDLSQYLEFLALENSASGIQQFEPAIVPGLLQQEDYARAVLQAFAGGATQQQIDEWVELRMRRQEELFERPDPPQMVFLMDEAVLHRWVGGSDVMRRQVLYLGELAAAENNVTIEVVPFRAGAHPGMRGPFVILEFADDLVGDILFLENSRGDMIIREEELEIAPARHALARLQELVTQEDIKTVIKDALSRIEGSDSGARDGRR